jgi:hypothetical protein
MQNIVDVLSHMKPEVIEYTFDTFRLRDDLRRMLAVDSVGANEATILYAGRILEITARHAVGRAGLAVGSQLFVNMQLIQNLGIADSITMVWGNALRRLSNAGRHITMPLETADAALAIGCVDRWLTWFFCDDIHGPRCEALSASNDSNLMAQHPEHRQLIDDLLRQAALSVPEAYVLAQHISRRELFVRSAPLVGILVESLLSQGDLTFSCHILQQARGMHASDLRLGQLEALCQSRLGHFQEALTQLQNIQRKFPEDDETNGMLAGVHKRLWQSNRNLIHHLQTAHAIYTAGWKRSRQQNPYLGINAAATALYLGKRGESEETARQIMKLLDSTVAPSLDSQSDPGGTLPFWHQLSFAEACLLGGMEQQGIEIYERIAQRYPNRQKDLEVAFGQRDEILAFRNGM